MAGRRGEEFEENLDRVLLPMSFKEFILTTASHQLKKFIVRNITARVTLEILSGRIPIEAQKLLRYWDEISKIFETFLITGGFPLTVDNYLKQGRIGPGIYTLFIQLVRRDLEKYGYDPTKVDQVISRIIETLTDPVDYETIKSGTDIRSSTRLGEYIMALQNAYILASVPYYDPYKKRAILRKRRKYYFRDPFIYHAFKAWVLGLDPYETSLHTTKDPTTRGILTENIIAEHLIRLVTKYNNKPQIDPQAHLPYIGYWKTSKGEVDFIVKLRNTHIPIEVKQKEKIGKTQLSTLLKATSTLKNKGIIITKKPENLAQHTRYIEIPAPIFLITIT